MLLLRVVPIILGLELLQLLCATAESGCQRIQSTANHARDVRCITTAIIKRGTQHQRLHGGSQLLSEASSEGQVDCLWQHSHETKARVNEHLPIGGQLHPYSSLELYVSRPALDSNSLSRSGVWLLGWLFGIRDHETIIRYVTC